MKPMQQSASAFCRTRLVLCLCLVLAQRTSAQTVAAEDRVAGWRSDIDAYLVQLQQQHYVLKDRPLPDSLSRAARRLRALVPAISDERMLVELQRLAAFAGDGHTYVLPFGASRVAATIVPLRFYVFSDGLFVVDANPEFERWIGSRVVRFGTTSASNALARMTSVISRDNAMGTTWIAPVFLSFRGTLEAVTDASGPAGARLTLRDRAGKDTTVTLAYVPAPRMRGLPKLIAPRIATGREPPLWLRDIATPYALTDFGDSVVYVRFNQVMDAPGESLAQFAVRLRNELAKERPRALIIDVRHNNGGTKELLPPLVATLRDFEHDNPAARLYVITGRNTFSAAQVFVAQLARDTHAIFAGEPSSSRPNFVGEENVIMLPWSGAICSISNRAHENIPGDRRQWIAPAIPVSLSSRDYFAGRDPVLEAVLADVAKRARRSGLRRVSATDNGQVDRINP